MRIAVINFSGNVGKSTIARHLLLPRIKGAEMIAVESINSDDGDGEAVRGSEFGALSEHLLLTENAVVDVGSSNVEAFTRLMRQYQGSHEDMDMFVVPAVKEAKQLRDTINTIEALSGMGVEPERIRLVFNRVDVEDNIDNAFDPLFALYDETKSFTLHRKAAVQFSELYQRLRTLGVSIDDLLNDQTDWRAKLRETKDPDEQYRITTRISARRLAKSARENLDTVFETLTAKVKSKAKAATAAAR